VDSSVTAELKTTFVEPDCRDSDSGAPSIPLTDEGAERTSLCALDASTGRIVRLTSTSQALHVAQTGIVLVRDAPVEYRNGSAKAGPEPDLLVSGEPAWQSLLIRNISERAHLYLQFGDHHIDPEKAMKLNPGGYIKFDHPSRTDLFAMTDGETYTVPFIFSVEV
jgi:hypothetical protein